MSAIDEAVRAARVDKAKLEIVLQKEILEFEAKHGVTVDSIWMNRLTAVGSRVQVLVSADARVTVEV